MTFTHPNRGWLLNSYLGVGTCQFRTHHPTRPLLTIYKNLHVGGSYRRCLVTRLVDPRLFIFCPPILGLWNLL